MGKKNLKRQRLKSMRKSNNHNWILRRRTGSMLLAVLIAASMMPSFAFADEVPSQDAEVQTEALAEDGSLLLVTPDVELAEPEELLGQFFDAGVAEQTGIYPAQSSGGSLDGGMVRKKARLASRKTNLSEAEQEAYEIIKADVEKIAHGEEARAYSEVPSTGADIDFQVVISNLMTDMPYEFYWYDKTIGYLYGNGAVVGRPGYTVFYFSVSRDYWDADVTEQGVNCWADTAKTGSTSAAIDTVGRLINLCADYSDLDKLYTYAGVICELTSYNTEAVKESNAYYAAIRAGRHADPFYGDPWQLIYVFDGDESTKVVCEGYAKALQYLCDRSQFSDDSIECFTVSGDLISKDSNLGGHMWNILHMDNGGNYIADLTNCDSKSTDAYFLRGYTRGNVSDGYTFLNLSYIYDDDTATGYYDRKGNFHQPLFSEEELTLSDTDYETEGPIVTHIPAKEVTCTADGNPEYWIRLGAYYSDEACSNRMSYKDVVLKAGHVWSDWEKTTTPTCTAIGAEERTCSRCGEKESREIAALGHSWIAQDSLDTTAYTCSRCGDSHTVSKVIVDLPKVAIRKPAKAKKAFTAKWKKLSSKNRKKIAGIEIQYSTDKSFGDAVSVVKTAKNKASSKKIKKLAGKQKYYVRVRAYKWIGGTKHVSKWSGIRSVRTK